MGIEFNILIVEDDEKTFKVLKEGLAETNYKLWRVTTGNEALKLAKQIYFTIVISEIRIADMDGIKLIKRLKKIDYKINIIILTTYSFSDTAVTALEAGAYAYLMKPLKIAELKLVSKRAIESGSLLSQAGKKKYYQDMSILDGLTGVYNHRYFHEKLNWHIEHLRRFPQAFSLFMIDIDDFKKYNDTSGHLEGDKVLHDVAQLFVDSLRQDDAVCRYGGEEFAIILPQTDKCHAARVGQRLLEVVRAKLPLTVSIGLARFPEDAQANKDLIEKADKALYRAKRMGKNRACEYDKKLDK